MPHFPSAVTVRSLSDGVIARPLARGAAAI